MSKTLNYHPRIRSVGLNGVLVTFGEAATDAANRAAIAFRSAVDDLNWSEIEESSSTLVSAFFRVDLASHSYSKLHDKLNDILISQDWSDVALPGGRNLWTIPAVFGTERAPQLAEAAEAAGLTVAQAEADLMAARLRVLTIGFAPGQPYLGTLGTAWDIPRQVGLSPNIPAGALVTAVRQMCLFTKNTPTGWRHVGQTAFQCFRPKGDIPFPLSPGDEIRFAPITTRELTDIERHNADGSGGALREVLA